MHRSRWGKDEINDYLREHDTSHPPAKSQPATGGATPLSESQPVVNRVKMQMSSAKDIAQTSFPSLETAIYVTSGSAVTTLAPNAGREAIHKTRSSSLTTLAPINCSKTSTPVSYTPHFNLSRATSTTVATSPTQMHLSPGMSTWSCGPQPVALDASATEFYHAITPQQSAATYIYSAPPFKQRANPQLRIQPDPWVAVTEAIKQGHPYRK